MTDTLEHQEQPTHQTLDRPDQDATPSRSRLPLFVVLGGAAVVLAAAAIAFWPQSDPKPPVPASGFASGTTIDLVLTCPTADAPCSGGLTAPDGSQWYWSTDIGQTIPATWVAHEVTGHLQTDGEWGTVTYTSGQQSVTLVGGLASPEHSFFG
jgi:hypothetical protein